MEIYDYNFANNPKFYERVGAPNKLIGSIFILVCDIFVQLLESSIHIPINALTSIIGAPFVIVIVLKRLA